MDEVLKSEAKQIHMRNASIIECHVVRALTEPCAL